MFAMRMKQWSWYHDDEDWKCFKAENLDNLCGQLKSAEGYKKDERGGFCTCHEGGYRMELIDHDKSHEDLSNYRCVPEPFGPEKCKN
jgi:hypothetical protein